MKKTSLHLSAAVLFTLPTFFYTPDTSAAPSEQRPAVSIEPILEGLKSENAGSRNESIIAIAHLGRSDLSAYLAPLLVDSDPIVARAAEGTLIQLKAINTALALIDTPTSSEELRDAALRVLGRIHTTPVIDAIVVRLEREENATRRIGFARALSSLYFIQTKPEANSDAPLSHKQQTESKPEKWAESDRIEKELSALLQKAKPTEATALSLEFARAGIKPSGAIPKLIELTQQDVTMAPTLALQLAQEESVPSEVVPLLLPTLLDAKQSDHARALAIQVLVKTDNTKALEAVLEILPSIKKTSGSEKDVQNAHAAFLKAPHLEKIQSQITQLAAANKGEPSQWAETVLIHLATRKLGTPESRKMATKAINEGWDSGAQRRIQLMQAISSMNKSYQPLEKAIALALEDENGAVRKSADMLLKSLHLDPESILGSDRPSGPLISTLTGAEALSRVIHLKGDAKRGEQIFTQLGCIQCHTISQREPIRGPYLGNVGQTYTRTELAEAIFYPNKTITQGFATQRIKLTDGSTQLGFIIQETPENITLRNSTGQDTIIPTESVSERTTEPQSMMPDGLLGNLHLRDFASLLEFLMGLSKGLK